MYFSFRMLRVVEAIHINLILLFVSEIHFGYMHYVDFLVKQEVSHFQFLLADAVCIQVAYSELVHFFETNL